MIHHQGASYSTWLKLQDGSIVPVDMDVVGVMAAATTPTLSMLKDTIEPFL